MYNRYSTDYRDFFVRKERFLQKQKESRQTRHGCLTAFVWWLILFTVLSLTAILSGCTTHKFVAHQHHQHYEADSIAIQAAIDSHLTVWQTQMDSIMNQRFTQYNAEWFSHSNEKEITTETVTVTLDSIGREVRTEQRRIERTLSQQQQQHEQRIISEYESRIRVAVDSLESIWQSRYDSLNTHIDKNDSVSNVVKPAEHTITSWQKFRIHLANAMLFFIAIAALVWIIKKRSWWIKLFVRS